jgi:hypothetical protein
MLIELTHERLVEQGFSEKDATAAMKELEDQLDEVTVTVTYEDVLGNVVADSEQLN